jgi:hypothetical protein
MAARILRMNGDVEPLGKAWVQKYIQRNPRVKSVVGRPSEARASQRGMAKPNPRVQ